MNTVTPEQVEVRTRSLNYQTEYIHSVAIKASEIGSPSWEWMLPVLLKLEKDTAIRPMASAHFLALRDGLAVITTLKEWHELIRSPLSKCTAEMLARLFTSFDCKLSENLVLGSKKISDVSQQVRHFILGGLVDESDLREKLSRIYRSVHVYRSKGRPLISDMPWAGRPPVSALPHENYSELKEKIQRRLVEDLEIILKACDDVLNKYEKAVEAINALANHSLPTDRYLYLQKKRVTASEIIPK